jgi:hypothetical protein
LPPPLTALRYKVCMGLPHIIVPLKKLEALKRIRASLDKFYFLNIILKKQPGDFERLNKSDLIPCSILALSYQVTELFH